MTTVRLRLPFREWSRLVEKPNGLAPARAWAGMVERLLNGPPVELPSSAELLADLMCYGTAATLGGKRITPEALFDRPPPSPAIWESEANKDRTAREDRPHG